MRKILILLGLAMALVSCEDFFEQDISKDNVRIIAPVDGVTVTAGDIKFLWDEVKGATAYRIVVVSPSFAEAGAVVGDEILVNDTLTRHRSYTCELEAGDYQWSLAAMNSAYSTPQKIHTLHVMAGTEENVPEEGENAGGTE